MLLDLNFQFSSWHFVYCDRKGSQNKFVLFFIFTSQLEHISLIYNWRYLFGARICVFVIK